MMPDLKKITSLVSRHLAKVNAAVVTIVVIATLVILTGFTVDLLWLIAPIAGLAWVIHQLTTTKLQIRSPGQQTLSIGSKESAVLIGSLLAIIIGYFIIRNRQDPPTPSGGLPTGATGSALPAPPQVPTDAEVLAFLRENIAEPKVEDESKEALPWKLLPVATNPLVQPETTFPPQYYNPLRDQVMLTTIDLSLYEGGQATASLVAAQPTLIDNRSDRLPQYQGSIGQLRTHCGIVAEAGGIQFLPSSRYRDLDEAVTVEFSVKPRRDLHAVWLKAERINERVDIKPDPILGDGWMEWGKIPLSIGRKSLQRVVVQVEVRHPDKIGALLTVNDLSDLQKMPLQPAFLIVGKSGKTKEVVFSTSGQERIATDEVGFTDEYCTVYIRLPYNRSLRWRISVRCDWPPGT